MFSISSPTLRGTITDYQVEFPRYQRNKAWDPEDKFKLFISVFKSYPIGSIVVKELIKGDKFRWKTDIRSDKRYAESRNSLWLGQILLWIQRL